MQFATVSMPYNRVCIMKASIENRSRIVVIKKQRNRSPKNSTKLMKLMKICLMSIT